jgi:O-antigen ligase
MNKYILYALFLAIPFANIPIAGHIYPLEIPLLLLVFSTLFSNEKSTRSIRTLDALVLIYAIFSLVSVVAGADSLYESARHYRLLVLTPTLLYFVIRYSPQPMEVMHKGIYLMLPGIFIQGMLLANYYILYGERPVSVEGATSTITASLFFAIGVGIILFAHAKPSIPILRRILKYLCICALLILLILSSTRAATIGLILLAPLTWYAWKRKHYTRLLGSAMMGFVFGMIALIITGTAIFSDTSNDLSQEESREITHTTGRLLSPKLYAEDLRHRMAFWGRMGKQALENPILGSGAARAAIGTSGGTAFHLGSAHNILVTIMITSGIIGLIIFVLMIWATYHALARSPRANGTQDSLGKIILLGFSVTLLVALTNDLSGGRVFIWFALMAMATRLLTNRPIPIQKTGIIPVEQSRILSYRKTDGPPSKMVPRREIIES